MKTTLALLLALAGCVSQPRVETKAPAQTNWFSITNSSMAEFDAWKPNLFYDPDPYSEPRYSLAVTEISQAGQYFPLLVQLRTYTKTNITHEIIRNPNPVWQNGFKITMDWIDGPPITNLVTFHVLGYLNGTNAVELLEIEKPQTK